MPEIVEDLGVVSIDAKLYNVLIQNGRRQLTSQLASVYPPKIVVSDTDAASDPRRSSITYRDHRGGLGVDYMRDQTDIDRVRFSDMQLRYDGHLVLQVTQAGPSLVTGGAAGFIGELASEIYVSFGTSVYRYQNATNDYPSSVDTLPAAATDSLTIRLAGTVYLVIATTGGWTWTSDGSSFTDITDDAKYLAEFNDKLWTIDNTGQVRSYSAIGATAVTGPQLPLQDGYVTGWVKGRDASANVILIAVTQVGLFALDIGNNKFVAIDPPLPHNADNAAGGATNWRDAIYYPSGQAVLKFSQGGSTSIVQPIGPDRDHGLLKNYQGNITASEATHNELMAAIESDDTSTSGFNGIYGWDGLGWQLVHAELNLTSTPIQPLLASSAYGIYRLYYGYNSRMFFIPLFTGLINPEQVISPPQYTLNGDIFFPWFDAGQNDVDKLALELKIEVQDLGGSFDSVVVSFFTNYDTTTSTTLATITTNGETILTFPDNGTNPDIGTVFRAIMIRLVVTRGSTDTITPDIRHVTLEYRKKLKEKLGFRCVLDLTKDSPDGRTPKQQRADLLTARQSKTKVEFTYRNDDTAGLPRNYYVDVIEATNLEETGLSEVGTSTVVLAEP